MRKYESRAEQRRRQRRRQRNMWHDQHFWEWVGLVFAILVVALIVEGGPLNDLINK